MFSCRLLLGNLSADTTASQIKAKLENQGFLVKFANMKFSIDTENQVLTALSTTDNPSVYTSKVSLSSFLNTTRCKCYLEIACCEEIEDLLFAVLFSMGTVQHVSSNQNLLPTAKTCGYLWEKTGLMPHILSYFQSPPKNIPSFYRDNSYNLLGLEFQKLKRCYSSILQDSFYFSQFVVMHHPRNFLLLDSKWMQNRSLVSLAVARDGELFSYASEKLKDDKGIVRLAMRNHVRAFESASDRLQKDEELLIAYWLEKQQLDPKLPMLGHVPHSLLRLKHFVLVMIHINANNFEFVDSSVFLPKEYEDIAVAALQRNALLLRFASQPLRNDFNIVMTAIKQNIKAREYAGSSLMNDKHFRILLLHLDEEVSLDPIPDSLIQDVEYMQIYRQTALKLISKKGCLLRRIHSAFHKDDEFMRAAVHQNPMNLCLVTPALKEDGEFVLEAVHRDGYAIRFAADFLFQCPEIVDAAKASILRQVDPNKSIDRIFNLPPSFVSDRDFILQLLAKDGLQLQYLPIEYKNNWKIIFTAIESNHEAIQFVPTSIKFEYQFPKTAVEHNPMALKYFASKFKDDDTFMRAVVKNGYAFCYAPTHLKQSKQFIDLAKESIIAGIKDFSLKNRFLDLTDEFLYDREFILRVVEKDGLQLKHIPNVFRNDFDIVMAAIFSNKNAIQFAHEDHVHQLQAMIEENEISELQFFNSTSNESNSIEQMVL